METVSSTNNKPNFWWLILPLLVGAATRLLYISGQVLGGDELHAVRVTLLRPLSEILFTYQRSDHCIPLTALYRLISDSGVTMTELVFRLPVLACGLVMLVAFPLLAAPLVGRRAALVFSWLLAISPVMIFYSRIVRSYAPMVILIFCALLFFFSWWQGRGRGYGLLFILFSAMALYFHLGSGPIIAAPYLYAAGELLAERRWRGGKRPGLLHLVLLGAAQVLAVAAFLVPARKTLGALVGAKRIEQSFSFQVLGEALRLQSGTVPLVLALLFWLAALAGLVMLLRRNRRFGLFCIVVIVVHLAGLAVLSPYGIKMTHVLNRYLLPVLPFILLCVALALSRPWPGSRGERWKPLVTAAMLLVLVLGGPLFNRELRRSSFVHNNDYLYFITPQLDVDPGAVPGFYRQLARGEVEGGPLLEYPWTTVWNQSQALYIYQRLHGQEVLVGAMDELLDDQRLHFRNMPRIDAEAFLASRARYLVIHTDWAAEEARVEKSRWIKSDLAGKLRGAARRLGERVGRSWGPPLYSDGQVVVWDMDRVRARVERQRSRSGRGER